MTSIRPSNRDRAAYRAECREKLSGHIFSKLGIKVKPADVRLITTADDVYAWRFLPGKQHLFDKHLSKHSVGAYRELCREVGISFEAVPLSTLNSNANSEENSKMSAPPGTSFASVIQELEAEKTRLLVELYKLRENLATAIESKETAESEVHRLGTQLAATDCEKVLLQRQVQGLKEGADCIKAKTLKHLDELVAKLQLDLAGNNDHGS